jgi:hypothetical protein
MWDPKYLATHHVRVTRELQRWLFRLRQSDCISTFPNLFVLSTRLCIAYQLIHSQEVHLRGRQAELSKRQRLAQ